MHAQANTGPTRRVQVKGHPGVYYRLGADGKRRYEVSYYDSDGKRRWETVDGGLEEADDLRADRRGRKRRGERVTRSRLTFNEAADQWLVSQSHLRPRTIEAYTLGLGRLRPRFGRMPLASITEDDVAGLIADMRRAGYAGWTIRGTLTPLGRVLGHAARRGWIAANVVSRLDKSERPPKTTREMRILDKDEIGAMLDAADAAYRALLTTAVFTGVRIGELLGLTWADVDLRGSVVRVRYQLDRQGVRVPLKTAQGVRDVRFPLVVGSVLRAHRLACPHSRDRDLVFASATGHALDRRNVARRGLERALQRAGLTDTGRARIRFHDLRHTYASILIAQGEDIVYVSQQLGHASPDITLRVYAHRFNHAAHAERAGERTEAEFGAMLRRTVLKEAVR